MYGSGCPMTILSIVSWWCSTCQLEKKLQRWEQVFRSFNSKGIHSSLYFCKVKLNITSFSWMGYYAYRCKHDLRFDSYNSKIISLLLFFSWHPDQNQQESKRQQQSSAMLNSFSCMTWSLSLENQAIFKMVEACEHCIPQNCKGKTVQFSLSHRKQAKAKGAHSAGHWLLAWRMPGCSVLPLSHWDYFQYCCLTWSCVSFLRAMYFLMPGCLHRLGREVWKFPFLSFRNNTFVKIELWPIKQFLYIPLSFSWVDLYWKWVKVVIFLFLFIVWPVCLVLNKDNFSLQF